ncbi:hypothetical protein [Pseudacidovorax sp. NFM-22]|uniref:hypothetical protein n=1 Tax=Pseudacidovorax sp. NFM-22 TaxID=2744469 RepID=UPI001F1C4EF3|nr:hypothetical protein [Pseudacidovorax sp. NFM-22]
MKNIILIVASVLIFPIVSRRIKDVGYLKAFFIGFASFPALCLAYFIYKTGWIKGYESFLHSLENMVVQDLIFMVIACSFCGIGAIVMVYYGRLVAKAGSEKKNIADADKNP